MNRRTRKEQFALLVSVSCLTTTTLPALSPALPELAEALGVSITVVGWVQGAVSFPGILTAVLVGYLADRFGGRRVVVVCVAAFTVFGAAGFLADSFPMLIVLRLLQGLGTPGLMGLSIALIGELFEDEKDRMRFLGMNLAFVFMVQMIMPALSGFIATGGAFRTFLIYLAGIPIGLWALRLKVGRPKGVASSPLRHVRAAREDMHRKRTGVDLLGLMAVTGLGVIVNAGASMTAVPLFLDDAFGTGSAGRGLVVSAFQAGAIVTALGVLRFIKGRISSRVMTAGLWLMCIGLLVVYLARFPAMVSLGLALAGAGFGLVVTLAQRDAIASASITYRGLVVLTWVAGVRVSQVIGPPMASLMTGLIGPRSAFLMIAAIAALAAVSWRPVRGWLKRMVYG
ncbi:MAG: MFS transporter [bacterium]|nr:MFS transporter [Acidimicrobiia bacterium]MCY4621412.1 MFS transporter [bacterium]